MDVVKLLEFAYSQDASDLHLSSGEAPMVRIHGSLKRIKAPPLNPEETRVMVYDIMNDEQRKIFEEKNDIDFSIEVGSFARFRVNVFKHSRGIGAVFRKIPQKILGIDELGLPSILKEISKQPKGLVLVTGPTGSGKSTTLAAMIDFINENFEHHILTIEDPIEFVHKPKRSLINQREVGNHTKSFANALRAALREDPDVILVGEMRDLETIQLALTAAETGHLVFGTLHTSSAPKTVDRIVDVFPPEQQQQVRTMFSESIQAVIAQTLCKKIGGGRVAALEIMLGTPAVRNLIREGKIHQLPGVIQTSYSVGMQTLEFHLRQLVEKKVISPETMQEKLGFLNHTP
ncbi:MAG: type IV pilus twitching motility protein PilT [Deltaproteobacteria bacterium]|nr:type IV pilus twitching motility protein PilT [Deltaproteobacteria bacterium]MCX7953193.1 type IV pilus twitching motility protein PilT [Deltaproteobacteria bacterium]